MQYYFLFLLLFIYSFSALSECSPVNLITENESPFQQLPVYDQKKTNICYAYSASQMANYYLIKKGETAKVHPAWIALNYARAMGRKSLYIGHTKESLETLVREKNCTFSKVSDALSSWSGSPEETEATIIHKIEKGQASGVEILSGVLESPCAGDREKVTLPEVVRYNYRQLPDDASFESFLMKEERLKNAPFSVAYCARIWKDADYDGIDITSRGIRDSLKKNCDYHESLIVGRKQVQNSCQILVRNTWGNRWRKENRQWKCLCKDKLTGEFADDCSPATHPDDQFSVEACWIPSDKLSKNIGVVTFFQ